jgi:pimeloyl-ACP methyl ester carboxylesterase
LIPDGAYPRDCQGRRSKAEDGDQRFRKPRSMSGAPMFRMFALLGVLLGITVQASSLCAAPDDDSITPLGIGLEEIAYPFPVRFLDLVVEGQALRMAYMDVAPNGVGNGKTVVLFHGKSFSGNYWEATIRRLTDDGYRVVVPDQIGFGKSSKPDLRYSFDLLAANTRKLLDALGIQRAAIVGHSFGGMLAIYFAQTYPDTTAVLALENPIGLEDYRSAIPPQTLATLVATEMAQTPDSYRTFMKAFFATWAPERETFVDVFARILKSGEYPRYARASALTYEMIYQQPIRHELHLLAMPVLLIIGQSDRSVFFRRYARPEDIRTLGNWPELGRATAKELADGQLVEIDGAGHVSHLERPQEFLGALMKFLAARM